VTRRTPFGVVGVFLVLLGAGVILDANWTWRGGLLIVAGAALLVRDWRQA
jgi:hypothetical protein